MDITTKSIFTVNVFDDRKSKKIARWIKVVYIVQKVWQSYISFFSYPALYHNNNTSECSEVVIIVRADLPEHMKQSLFDP